MERQIISATLAAKPHLERWLDRLVPRTDELAEIGALAGVANGWSRLAVRVELRDCGPRIPWPLGTYVATGSGWAPAANLTVTVDLECQILQSAMGLRL